MNSFKPANLDRERMEFDVEYYPLRFTAGTETFRFALHRSVADRFLPIDKQEWAVSDPDSGAQVRKVVGDYKGVPVSSRGASMHDAKAWALADLEALISRIGPEKFCAVVHKGREAAK